MLNRRYRSRLLLLAGMVLVVGAGLASRSFPQALPLGLGGYPGDALWALLVFLALAFVKPGSRTSRLAMAALSVSYLVEAAQLYQDPWVNSIRSSTAGHLVLGQQLAASLAPQNASLRPTETVRAVNPPTSL